MPFLEISHAAKIGTVVGSIDLSRLVSATNPEAALLPGTIPQAHRGIIFVDEINRLAETSPELADVLLDVMGTRPGRVQIEETGLPPVELPVLVSVWAASNPDEEPGPLEEIRRQLSDRFDFAIYTDRPGDPGVVEQILAAAEAGEPARRSIAETKAELWRTRLTLRTAELRKVAVPSGLRRQVAGLYSQFDLESLRAVEAIQAGVRLSACLEGRTEVQLADLLRVAPLALRHRVDPELLRRVTSYLAEAAAQPEAAPAAGAAQATHAAGAAHAANVAHSASVAHAANVAHAAAAAHAANAAQADNAARAPNVGNAGHAHAGAAPRPRFPGLSFGGVLAEPAQAASGGGERRPGSGAGVPGSTQTRAAGAAGPQGGAGGVQAGAGAGSRASDPAASQVGEGSGPGNGTPAPPRADATQARPRGRGGTSWLRRALSQLGLAPALPDPAELPPQAPPHPARPLSALAPEEWVRTEEELSRS